MDGKRKYGGGFPACLPEVKGWSEAEQRSALGFELSIRNSEQRRTEERKTG
jgi:hypothetical protein